MDHTELLTAVANALRPLIEAQGGVLEVCETPDEAEAFFEAAPHRWRVVLHWRGYGEHEAAREGMTTHQLTTTVQQRRGLVHRPGQHAAGELLPSGELPFSARIGLVSGWMRAMRLPDAANADHAGFSLSSSGWDFTGSRTPFHSHTFLWSLVAAHDSYNLTIPLTVSN